MTQTPPPSWRTVFVSPGEGMEPEETIEYLEEIEPKAFDAAHLRACLARWPHCRPTTSAAAGDEAKCLSCAYFIPMIYVPLLMITHIVAFILLLRPSMSADSPARQESAG